ncbi:unnamed protein product, partial [Heterotrigona itama]
MRNEVIPSGFGWLEEEGDALITLQSGHLKIPIATLRPNWVMICSVEIYAFAFGHVKIPERSLRLADTLRLTALQTTKPCENPNDFRAEQCAVFDDVPYSGQLLKWYPHYDPTRPCALICRGEQSLENTGSRLRQETSVEKTLPHDATDALQLDSEETIVVQLADKVEDGTKCYADNMDVCIGGECM